MHHRFALDLSAVAARALQAGTICVPVAPETARPRLGGSVISARLPPPSRKAIPASFLGPMLLFENCPAERCLRPSSSGTLPSHRWSVLQKLTATFSTAVETTN